jgi:D-alanyl-lipoteichoic acid acyltransferase DltB (MBOAT superfamily)
MLFNSYEFIFAFLPISFFLYFFLLQKRLIVGAKAFLVFSSLFFYSWWNIMYLPLILSSMLFNYVIGQSLNNNFEKIIINKKSLLFFGIFINLGLLGYFKYTDFFIVNINVVTQSSLPLLNLALPLAISFFTFQQIAYLVDSYRVETKEYDFLNYALFVTFFPQLIAGPIVHHSEMMPQFVSKWNLVKKYKNIALGIFIFAIGLFKKVVIADTFSVWATNGFDVAQKLNLFEAWATSLSYTFQVYFDFSGYTDMAIGIALLFNIRLPINFNSPYKAVSIQDFWRRWHITLSRFLRDYIYIPLGGNRLGSFRTYANLMATFILGGLWHGAGWTFIFWGFLHGVALVIHRIWKKFGFTLWSWISWFITFNFINISWIFFRAKEWDDAIKVVNSMFSLDNIVLNPLLQNKLSLLSQYGVKFGSMFIDIDGSLWTIISLFIISVIVLFFKNSIEMLDRFEPTFIKGMIFIITFIVSFYKLSGNSEFLYFRF